MIIDDVSSWYLQHGTELEKAREAEKLLVQHEAALKALNIDYNPNLALASGSEQLLLDAG